MQMTTRIVAGMVACKPMWVSPARNSSVPSDPSTEQASNERNGEFSLHGAMV
jgi:hypothetical protein